LAFERAFVGSQGAIGLPIRQGMTSESDMLQKRIRKWYQPSKVGKLRELEQKM